jgi:SagB-type dehydrogenase family enzyme
MIGANMKKIRLALVIASVLIFVSGVALCEELKEIQLPPPRTDGGMPLMQALKLRSTSRSFSSKELPVEILSDMLWAAFGVNRAEKGGRTAPSAMNWQEIDIYVALKDGLYIYDAKKHLLAPVLAEDIRALTGIQKMAKEAPVSLVFVADFAKMKPVTKDEKIFYSAADTGYISQNIYLYCASEGLATGVRGMVDRPVLEKKIGLTKDQKIILAQSVGYPGDAEAEK